jgi:serine/threonine protein phosphatase PrpC
MLKYCGATDKGERKNNEDAYAAFTLEHPSGKLHILAVADGLGGHRGGEIASKLAIMEMKETISRSASSYEKITQQAMKELLEKAYRKANEEVCYQAKIIPEMHGMGTTLVAALLDDDGVGVAANVGDSRAYLIGDGMKRITKDHSYVQELVDKGVITQEEAAVHPEKNVVTRIIGMEGVEPDFYEIELGRDALLLCSDGLTDGFGEKEIYQVVLNSVPTDICKHLVGAAKYVSHDNITVITVMKLQKDISESIVEGQSVEQIAGMQHEFEKAMMGIS